MRVLYIAIADGEFSEMELDERKLFPENELAEIEACDLTVIRFHEGHFEQATAVCESTDDEDGDPIEVYSFDGWVRV